MASSRQDVNPLDFLNTPIVALRDSNPFLQGWRKIWITIWCWCLGYPEESSSYRIRENCFPVWYHRFAWNAETPQTHKEGREEKHRLVRCISSKHSVLIFFTAARHKTMRNSNFLSQLLPSLYIWNTDCQRLQLCPILWHSLLWNSGYTEHAHFISSTSLAPFISLNIKQHPLLALYPN